ncbi:MAG: hypothetical protein H6962_05375 [Chromatiaceae bacterium]|nr:hypothetical protein [Chromatiaceae bacterium]
MPGGTGPVSASTIAACTRQDRAIAPVVNANEIFFNLDARRVFYDGGTSQLYFVGTVQELVPRTIRATLAAQCLPPVFEQLHLDCHHLINGAQRVTLGWEQVDAVLVALRLVGVRTTVR